MNQKILPVILGWMTASAVQSASATTTYTTLSGEVNLVAGLTNLSSSTAINPTNQATGIDLITDDSWSTGIANLGGGGVPIDGTLAGSFGGATYFAGTSGIILIGAGGAELDWGSWTIRLLLANDTYSSPISFTDGAQVLNPSVLTAANSEFFMHGNMFYPGATPTHYQVLNVAAFDPGNIGFKGIELSNLGTDYPDLNYIGVTGSTSPVPEPSASLSLLGLLGAGLLYRRRGGA